MPKFEFVLIREDEDRSFTLPLVDEIAQGRLDDLHQVAKTLSVLDDPRALDPLTQLMLDPDTPLDVRQAASDALYGCSTLETADERSRWWHSGDSILMRHVIRVAERSEQDLVVMVASDQDHDFHIDAIRTCEHWEEPRFQNLIIKALDHKDPDVREAAARALLWEQPVAAERKLMELASDVSHKDVAQEALDTLCYCASQEILLTLDQLRRDGPPELREDYERVLDYVVEEFQRELQFPYDCAEAVKSNFLSWIEPVKHLLAPKESRDLGAQLAPVESANQPVDRTKAYEPVLTSTDVRAQPIIDDLSEADGKWCRKKQRYLRKDWKEIEQSERERLSKFLCEHCDPEVRGIACEAMVQWQDAGKLLELMSDRVMCVRKSASYLSRKLPPTEKVAQRLLELLNCDDTKGCFATEVLESYLLHTPDIDHTSLLLDLALNDPRPSVKYASVYALDHSEMMPLLPLLGDEPFNTWSTHIAIIDACVGTSIPLPPLDHLRSVDNLWLQSALAKVC